LGDQLLEQQSDGSAIEAGGGTPGGVVEHAVLPQHPEQDGRWIM
jgi:hypothetical protein